MIFIKLLIAVIFAISTLLVFDTRNIVKRYFMNEDRNDISIIISIFLVKMLII